MTALKGVWLMSVVVMILLKDGLQFPSEMISEASYSLLIYCRVPEEWISEPIPDSNDLWLKGPSLTPERLETVLETIYGATWRRGNEDGSRYVVLAMGSRLLNPRHASEKPWLQDDLSNPAMRYFYYVADEDGKLQRALPSGL